MIADLEDAERVDRLARISYAQHAKTNLWRTQTFEDLPAESHEYYRDFARYVILWLTLTPNLKLWQLARHVMFAMTPESAAIECPDTIWKTAPDRLRQVYMAMCRAMRKELLKG